MRARMMFFNETPTPVGRLLSGGVLRDSPGVARAPMRVLGRYAVVMVTRGSGTYWEARNSWRVETGDLILLMPEVAHAYLPDRDASGRAVWDEWHFIFDGPVFDLWRAQGVFDEARPVRKLGDLNLWRARAETFISAPRPVTLAARTREITRFLELLTALLTAPERISEDGAPREPEDVPAWLQRACASLEEQLDAPLSPERVAQDVGLSYESFRKKFAQHTGTSPARYRMARRIEAACALLVQGDWTQRAVARRLGFRDEFHFARCFKAVTGVSPGEFRRRRAV